MGCEVTILEPSSAVWHASVGQLHVIPQKAAQLGELGAEMESTLNAEKEKKIVIFLLFLVLFSNEPRNQNGKIAFVSRGSCFLALNRRARLSHVLRIF